MCVVCMCVYVYICAVMKTMCPPGLSPQWLCDNSCIWAVHRIISFRIISKIGVNRKDKDLTRKELHHRYLPFCLKNVRGF